MKKYLMTAMAAVAMGVAFTSCSHNTDPYGGEEGGGKVNGRSIQEQIELDKAVYKAAFEQSFGKVAPTVDWGFGSTSVAGVRGGTRTVTGIKFPTFKDKQCPTMPTQYSNTVPANAKYAKDYQNYQKGDVIYINTDYQTLNNPQNTEDLTIYVDGNVTYVGGTNQNGNGTTICVTQNSTLKLGSVSERLTIYLAPGATLDITEGMELDWSAGVWPAPAKKTGNNTFTFTKENAALYMSSGSTVKATNLYFKDGYTVLNEGGTIETTDLHVENGAVLYNKNEIKATGVIALRNTNGEIDNFGKMSGASMTLDANARFNNVAGGEVNISGLTKLNNDSGNNAWMNGGQFNTGSFEITGGCQDPAAFNNCHMSVTGEFFMNHGNFVLDGGAAVEAASFKWESDNYFHMGGKALLKVTGQMLMNNQNNSPQYGFWGDDTDYAVIWAGSIEKGSKGKCRAAYYGNLFIDTDSHFTQGENSADGTWYTFGDNVKFSFTDNTDVSGYQTSGAKTAKKAENFSLDIPKDNAGCSPGYKYGAGTPTYRVIVEDLSATQGSDFDFNDVVFDVDPDTDGQGATITILAAGGIWPLTVAGEEVHQLLIPGIGKTNTYKKDDVEYECYPMINTGVSEPKGASTTNQPTIHVTGNYNNDDNIRQSIKDIVIKVFKYGDTEGVELQANKGEAACKVLVDKEFGINSEYNSIAINSRFKEYVQGRFTGARWWSNVE